MKKIRNCRRVRIGLFVDGPFLAAVNRYYRLCHPIGRALRLAGLQWLAPQLVSALEDHPLDRCELVETHVFETRPAPAKAGGDGAVGDCVPSEHLLIGRGLTIHVLVGPVKDTVGAQGPVSSALSLEAFDLATQGVIDVLMLAAGANDYAALGRKLRHLGIPSVLLEWPLQQPGLSLARAARASEILTSEIPLRLNMLASIENLLADPTNPAIETFFGFVAMPPPNQPIGLLPIN